MMQVSDSNLGKLSALLQSIAAGDLTARMHGDFQGVFAQMRDDANTTADQLTNIVGRIQTAATSINACCLQRNRHRQRRPIAPHRAAGRQPGGNRRLDGRTDLHRQTECRKRASGQPACHRCRLGCLARRCRGRSSGSDHERHRDLLEENRRHHQRHRRHRVPDQYPGPECGGGSGACRRTRPRFRRGRQRSTYPRPAFGQCRQGDQGPDRRFGRPQTRVRPTSLPSVPPRLPRKAVPWSVKWFRP